MSKVNSGGRRKRFVGCTVLTSKGAMSEVCTCVCAFPKGYAGSRGRLPIPVPCHPIIRLSPDINLIGWAVVDALSERFAGMKSLSNDKP